MRIRPVSSLDFAAIVDVHRQAFAVTEFGYQGEGELVQRLHDDGDAMLSLVAERAGQIVGHVLFSRMTVAADGRCLSASALAPVGVVPALHGQGIGSALIFAGLKRLAEDNVQISFVLGHADYYPLFGYSSALAEPFSSPFAGPHFMALFLDKSLGIPESGRADYAPAFSIRNGDEL